MTENEIATRAIERARAGKTLPLRAIFAALGSGPTKLARGDGDSITWVGGTLPNATRAIGVWSGGREASSVLTLPSKDVDEAAPEIARSAGQKSALWFTPGEGNDILHVLSVSAHPREVAAGLNKHGVNEFTLIPKNGKTLVHVVDAGGVRAASVRAYATESGAKYASRPGTSRFVNFTGSPSRLSRETDHDSFIDAIGTPIAGDAQDGSTLGPYADWLEEHGLPYAAFIREAGKQALDGEDFGYDQSIDGGPYGWFADTQGSTAALGPGHNHDRVKLPGNVSFTSYRSTSGHPVLSANLQSHVSRSEDGERPRVARVRAHVKSREHLRTLTADMPAVTREAIHAVFDPHLPK